MIPIDQTSFLQHPSRRHDTISHYPPLPPPTIPSSSSSTSPPLTYGAVSSSPLTNDPTEPTCEESKRSAHNALERQRREGLNSKFQQLAHALPGLQNIRRPSKSMVVGKSLEFVTRSVQRDSYYKNKIRQLRKEHDTLRKHTQRSQQYLKKRMNEAEEEKTNQQKAIMHAKSTAITSTSRRTSSSSSNGGIAAVDGENNNRHLDQQQYTSDVPVIKKHKTHSSSSSLTKKAATTAVHHKFVHHHTSSSNTQEKSTSTRRDYGKPIRTPPINATLKTENIDPAMVAMTPQQQSRNTPPVSNSVTPPNTSMFPIQVSWPPLDLSALQPPADDEGLGFYSPVDLYSSLANTPATTMVFDGTSNPPPQTCSAVTTITTPIPCNIPNYVTPSTLSNVSQPDSSYLHHNWT